MKRYWAIFAVLVMFATAVGAAKLITATQNVAMAMTLANGALQSEGCQTIYAAEYPDVEWSAIKLFTEDTYIVIVQFDNEVIQADFIAAVLPHINPKRIIVNETYAAIIPPLDMAETIIHEFFHLNDFSFGTEMQELTTEEQSQLRAKLCLDALWVVYPTAKPEDWVDGPRLTKVH
jgi:hypothetical protein